MVKPMFTLKDFRKEASMTTKYVIEYQNEDGGWHKAPKLFDSMSLAEIEAAYRKEPTRVVPIKG